MSVSKTYKQIFGTFISLDSMLVIITNICSMRTDGYKVIPSYDA